MGTKITARECLFSCAAVPEMIQYSCVLGCIIFGYVMVSAPVGAGADF